ncbi:MAG: hypothetical protein QXO04_04655 [Nitrososphaerota archaeon]
MPNWERGQRSRYRRRQGQGSIVVLCSSTVMPGIYAIIVKPRSDLEIKYPCEVRMEDGAIIVIDRERAERVAEER